MGNAAASIIDTIMSTFMITLAIVCIVLVIVLIVTVITMEREVKIDENVRKRGPIRLRDKGDEAEGDVPEGSSKET